MCARAGARSVAAMTARSIPAIALVALGASAAPAHAAGFVYGGTTRAGDAIVLTAPKGAAKLAGAVIAWHATCDDQMNFSDAAQLTPAKLGPGMPVDRNDLVVSRNGKGRFAGAEAYLEDLGTNTATISVGLNGRLSRSRASGTLSATVKIADKATGRGGRPSCQTGPVSVGGRCTPRARSTAAAARARRRCC